VLELNITVGEEQFDDVLSRFLPAATTTVTLEHSLVSVSKWESKFERPFLAEKERTTEETLAYVQMMSLDGKIPPGVLSRFTSEHYEAINKYINAKMTATTVNERPGSSLNRETITSELIYYWMVSYNIPFDCELWHLNRLLMLVRVCNAKNAPAKKRTHQEIAAERRAMNMERRQKHGTRG
jgi:hypothetical protein